jgi:lysophospholipase L1-like esterase
MSGFPRNTDHPATVLGSSLATLTSPPIAPENLMSSLSQARQMRASLRRVKAGGERFLGGVLPGATSRRLQTRAFADDWAAANLDAKQATGPLWIVLGDAASQGLGATTREAGYVGVVHEMLRRRDAWRVINLSRSGAGLADVLARQLPELAAHTAEEPAALVTCIIGAEDVARCTAGLDVTVRSLLAALPRGAIVATVPLRGRVADTTNAVIREEVVRHGLRLADLGITGGGPGRGNEAVRLNDVGHSTWAKVLIAAIDNPAPSQDPTPPHGIPVGAADQTEPAES